MADLTIIAALIAALCGVSFMLGRCYEEWKAIPELTIPVMGERDD